MIQVERNRCAYCGGCVSVCPVGALTLAETRLQVSEDCIDCGNCVPACPMGALQVDALTAVPHSSNKGYDVVVVGAGPGGSMAAAVAARAGLSVLLLEKRQEIGSPVRCAEGVGREALASLVEVDPRWIAAQVHQAQITVSGQGETRTLQAGGGQGYILERRVFDRALAERAAQAGATIWVKSAAVGLVLEDGRVCGVRVQRGMASAGAPIEEVACALVVAADGVEAQVGRWAGLDVQLPLRDTMVCAQYLLAGIDIDPTCTCYTLDYPLAPGGYAWIFPKGEGKANVGLGVQADLQPQAPGHLTGEAPGVPVLERLHRFIERDRALARGYPVTLVAGNVPVGLPLTPMTSGGVLLVGDAARQVDPLTGGGIVPAMTAGALAAEVAVEAIAAGDTSSGFLQRYEERWYSRIGRKMERNYRLRARFPADRRDDERFVHAFLLAVGG